MAPDRTSRNGGFGLPAKRNSALATAAMASAALLSQTGNASADEAPSPDEVNRRITNLYDRAENDSGTYNATRAAATASSPRGRTASGTGDGRGSGSEPSLDAIARQWYGVARAKLGPFVEATLPADRAPRPAEPRRPRAAEAPAAREPKAAERPVPELTARPVLALPSAPRTAPAALTAAPDPSPMWAPEPIPQNLSGTGEMPTVGTRQADAGFPEYPAQTGTGLPEYGAQPGSGFPEYTTQVGSGFPEYGGQLGTGLPEYTAQVGTAMPGYSGQLGTAVPAEYTAQSTGLPEYSGQFNTGFAETTGQFGTGLPEATGAYSTGLPEYTGQFGGGLPQNTGQFSAVPSDYTGQATTGFPDYTAGFGTPLAALASPSVDSSQAVPIVAQPIPFIPAPRAPEPEWQAPQPIPAPVDPASALPSADPGYDSKVIQVLAFARSQIGKPCVWGAAGPGSYDNSGLTQAAWKVAGVSLPRTAVGQANYGTAVELYAMQPGDLVFFQDDLSHVGLCTGNGMMIHAPGPGSSIREESIYPTGESIIRGAVRPA
ncbi:NlpC/P60 family protein [Streptomyces sp. NBC_00285]|uniref:NlpC/P60 family protein n=1 Tax=Streptomyces sp. NBC_00285 TaxID=2975700 RepID=UPI003FA7EB16